MIDTDLHPLNTVDRAAEYLATDAPILRSPTTRILIGLGIGVAAAVLIRALRSEPSSRRRLAALFRDLERRLERAGTPVLRKAGALASENIHSLANEAERGGERLSKSLQGAGRRLHRMLS
jgi:hypothetical protein